MINFNSIAYLPTDEEVETMDYLLEYKTLIAVSIKLKISAEAMRHRMGKLRLNVGVETNAQLGYWYGLYNSSRASTRSTVKLPYKLLKSPEMLHCLRCPKGKCVQDLKKYVEDVCMD